MDARTRTLLLRQGFDARDVDNEPEIVRLARWTPLCCASFGGAGLAVGLLPFGLTICPCAIFTLTGLWMGSGWFFVVLGLLTLTGGVTTRSIYDRFYNAAWRHLLHTSPAPAHGAPRQFGCALGGVMYVVSGLGFLIGNIWLAFLPATIMVVLATIAGLTQWCYASTVYAWLVQEKRGPYERRNKTGSKPPV